MTSLLAIIRLFYWIKLLILFANQKQSTNFHFKFYNSSLGEKEKVIFLFNWYF